MENWKKDLKTALAAYEEARQTGNGAGQAKVRLTNLLFNVRREIISQ